jgi:hypothetical protein
VPRCADISAKMCRHQCQDAHKISSAHSSWKAPWCTSVPDISAKMPSSADAQQRACNSTSGALQCWKAPWWRMCSRLEPLPLGSSGPCPRPLGPQVLKTPRVLKTASCAVVIKGTLVYLVAEKGQDPALHPQDPDPGCAVVIRGAPRCHQCQAAMCQGVPRCAKVCQGVPRCAKVCQDVPRCADISAKMPRSAVQHSSWKAPWCTWWRMCSRLEPLPLRSSGPCPRPLGPQDPALDP